MTDTETMVTDVLDSG
jgi:hypothetical protein